MFVVVKTLIRYLIVFDFNETINLRLRISILIFKKTRKFLIRTHKYSLLSDSELTYPKFLSK